MGWGIGYLVGSVGSGGGVTGYYCLGKGFHVLVVRVVVQCAAPVI